MPYGYRHRRRSAPKRRLHRRKAGVPGWKRAKNPRKRSAVVRQTEQNRRAIKVLKKATELKCTETTTAKPQNNYCGSSITRATPVDNYGLGMNSLTWLTNTTAKLPDTSPSSGVSNPAYLPVWQQPFYVEQGDSENERIGNEVKMHRMVVKLMITGGDSQENAGIFAAIVMPQKMHFFVILDTAPPPENSDLGDPAVQYQVPCIPGQLFTYDANWGMPMQYDTSPGNQDSGLVPGLNTNLKSLLLSSANPPGIHTNSLTNVDLVHQSFWSRDQDGISKGDRFKLLKHRTFHFYQKPPAAPETNHEGVRRSTVEHTETIKLPYRFRFDADSEVLPGNQRIYLVFASDTPTIRNSGATPPTNYIDSPTICTHTRTWFSDA